MNWIHFGKTWKGRNFSYADLPRTELLDDFILRTTGKTRADLSRVEFAEQQVQFMVTPGLLVWKAANTAELESVRKSVAESFCGVGLAVPGTVVVVGGRVLVVGHVNPAGEVGGGVSGEVLEDGDIVEYYATLEIPKPPFGG